MRTEPEALAPCACDGEGISLIDELTLELDRIEADAASQGDAFWSAQAELPFADTALGSLVSRVRVLLLILGAQHMLIRDLQGAGPHR